VKGCLPPASQVAGLPNPFIFLWNPQKPAASYAGKKSSVNPVVKELMQLHPPTHRTYRRVRSQLMHHKHVEMVEITIYWVCLKAMKSFQQPSQIIPVG
jgi:cytochrome P450